MGAGRFWRWISTPSASDNLGAHTRPGNILRGRVSRISVIKSGEVSVVIRFGIEESAARQMVPGTLLEVTEVPSE